MDPSRAADRRRLIAPSAVLIATAATVAVIGFGGGLSNQAHVLLVLVACAGYVTMVVAQGRWSGLPIRLVVAATFAQTAVAVVTPPRSTQDLWWYAIYGRMLAVYHASPYTHVAADFPHNPLLSLVGRSWRHTPSVYGPLFTGISGAAAFIFGASPLPTRLFYQALAAAALGAACIIVWRRTRSAGAVAFLAMNPMTALYLVNGGRNDILVGLAMLGAVVLAFDGREAAAGVVGGLGAMVKLTGLVGVVALVVAVACSRGRPAATRIAAAAGVTVIAGYLIAGAAAVLTPMGTAGAMFSRDSVWKLFPLVGVGAPATGIAILFLGVFVLFVMFRSARRGPATAVPATMTALTLGAAYTLPGYVGWALPVAALDHQSRVSRLVAAQGVVLVGVYEVVRHPIPGLAGDALMQGALVGGPLATLGLIVLLVRATRSLPDVAGRIVTPVQPVTRGERPMANALVPSARSAPSARSVLVVVPTYNERDNIDQLLLRTRAAVPRADILVVDDGSPDGTAERAESLSIDLGRISVLHRLDRSGLGSAYRAGFALGLDRGYDVIIEMDGDLSHDPASLPDLLQAVENGADLVIGSRYVLGGTTVNWSKRRRAISRAGGLYARVLLGVATRDITSGFRAYRGDLLRKVDLASVRASGYGFQIEMVYRASQVGAEITEVPIVFREREAGVSKMSVAIVIEALALVTRWGLRHHLRHTDRSDLRASPQPA